MDRRRLLLTAAAGASLAAAGPALARNGADARLDALLNGWFDEDVDSSPETATNLGLDRGDRVGLSSKLSDRSWEAWMVDRSTARNRQAALAAFDRTGLSDAGAVNLAVASFRAETAASGAKFDYGAAIDGGRMGPYLVNQMTGAYFTVPDFMDTQHRVEDRDGAEAFLARLSAFGPNLDAESDRIRRDADKGVVPPDFMIDLTLRQLKALRDQPAADMAMVKTLERKANALGLTGYGERAARMIDAEVKPSLGYQIEAFERLRPTAVHDAGVWRLPEGEAFYAHGLKYWTTTNMTPDEVHAVGLEQVAAISAEIDTILKSQGMTQGTVGERIDALNKDPAQLWPNTDEGKIALIESLNRQVAALEPRLPQMFGRLPRSKVEVRRVPPAIESGAPGGYYQGPPLDGSRPGAYYINLRDTANWPKFALPTLTYHEASPGHHLQVALQRETESLPAWRRANGFSAYNEGWALYAEAVAADDLHAYADDPLGRVGFLMSYLFRAVRLVVDTGLHHKRWSREQAVEYMAASGAKPINAANSEINRYCAMPAQACSYKIGHTVIARLRAEAGAKPGFDLRAFHDKVLVNGSLPLAVLEQLMKA
ncbi:Tat pathway signal protein [Brevundimonas sp. Root1279]|nr:Tat pathway signal protein [Brevundimonas sp. Root1279]